MNNKQIFLKHLTSFEGILNKFGYFKIGTDNTERATSKENLSVTFTQQEINRNFKIHYVLWKDGIIFLSISMYKIPSEKTFFSLSDFLKDHGLEDQISWKLEAGRDFDTFAKKFFDDLAVLFENELNDQITGKSFENHWEKLMKSMDDY